MLDAHNIQHVAFDGEGDTAERRLEVTNFLVEATHNEWHMLWSRWCAESRECCKPLVKNWEQLGGWLVTIGHLMNRPIVISLQWNRLDGFLVCNWTPTSQLVDHQMIDEWFEKHFTNKTKDGRPAICNAMNFHHCIQEMEG